MDYYSVLGVSKSASDSEIKKAFRKKAMELHPDKGGDPKAFQEINEAYDTLKDPQKKQMYDQYGTADPQQMRGNPFGSSFQFQGGPEDLQDIFSTFFGGGAPRMRRNKDIRLGYNIQFKDVFTGVGQTISFTLPSGRTEVIDVKIPAGVKNNDAVRVQGYGDDSVKELPRGDLIIKIKVINNTDWKRDGDNISIIKILDIFDFILGTKINLITPENKTVTVTIPQGTNPGTTLSVPGYGVPNVNTSRKGNIHVYLKSKMPTLDKQTLDELQRLRK